MEIRTNWTIQCFGTAKI